jgi:hypothetical protein
MADKTYVVKFKPQALRGIQVVVASTVEIHDEQLIFCNANGDLVALFLLEIVQSWSELPDVAR